jgi:hypothetical protein
MGMNWGFLTRYGNALLDMDYDLMREIAKYVDAEDLPQLAQVHPILRDFVKKLEVSDFPQLAVVQQVQLLQALAPTLRASGLRLRDWASLYKTEKFFWAEMSNLVETMKMGLPVDTMLQATKGRWGWLPKHKARRFTRAAPQDFRECVRYHLIDDFPEQWKTDPTMYADPQIAHPQIIEQVKAEARLMDITPYQGEHFRAGTIYVMGYMTQQHLNEAVIEGARYFDRVLSTKYTGEFQSAYDRMFNVYLGHIAYRNGRPYIRDNAEIWGLKFVKSRVIFAKPVGSHQRKLLPLNRISFTDIPWSFSSVKLAIQAAFLQGKLEGTAGLVMFTNQDIWTRAGWYQLCFLEDRVVEHFGATEQYVCADGAAGGRYLRIMVARMRAKTKRDSSGNTNTVCKIFEPIAGEGLEHRLPFTGNRYHCNKSYRLEQLLFLKKLKWQ